MSWQTKIVDPETGLPTAAFLDMWETVAKLGLDALSDVNISNPSDGQVLTYSAAQGKWIAS